MSNTVSSAEAKSILKDLKTNKFSTSRLFIIPTIESGIGSIINLSGNHYPFRFSKGAKMADNDAIYNDWGVVGQDVRGAGIAYLRMLEEKGELSEESISKIAKLRKRYKLNKHIRSYKPSSNDNSK